MTRTVHEWTEVLDESVQHFRSNGFVLLPNVLAPEHAQQLGELVEHRYQDPAVHECTELDLIRGDVSLMRMFEYDQAFRDIITLRPVIDIVERVLGDDCHVVAQNALRMPPGKGIVNWHIDDTLFFPFLADLYPASNPDSIPCFSLNAMLVLSDIESTEHGPTQVVAESHLSGHEPNYGQALPTGIEPTSLLASAGDVYLVNSQTWHRGAPNNSARTRYLLTTTYGRRFISQRFYPFLNYRMPDRVLENASDQQLRLLGKHGKGPYG